MRKYGKIETGFWQNPKVRNLSEDGRAALLYLLSCPHGNSAGCFVLPTAYVGHDLAWQSERVCLTLSELLRTGFIRRDEATQTTLIVGWWGHNTIENANVAKSVVAAINCLPNSSTKQHAITVLKGLTNLHETVAQTVSKLLPEPSLNPEPNLTEPEPEPQPARAREAAEPEAGVDLIKVFDEVRTAIFGENQGRSWPAPTDLVVARRWIDAGADVALCRAVFDAQNQRMKTAGKRPPGTLKFFDQDIADALAAAKSPMPHGRAHAGNGYAVGSLDDPNIDHLGNVWREHFRFWLQHTRWLGWNIDECPPRIVDEFRVELFAKPPPGIIIKPPAGTKPAEVEP